jgi:hypothetical protein
MMRSQLWVPLALKLAARLYGQLADLVIEQAKIADLSRWRATDVRYFGRRRHSDCPPELRAATTSRGRVANCAVANGLRRTLQRVSRYAGNPSWR